MMDPDAVLQLIDELLASDAPYKLAEANDACQNLFDWLARKGAHPNWKKFPAATAYFHVRAQGHRAGKRFTMPIEGSNLAEKRGVCRHCGQRWIADFTCPTHGRV